MSTDRTGEEGFGFFSEYLAAPGAGRSLIPREDHLGWPIESEGEGAAFAQTVLEAESATHGTRLIGLHLKKGWGLAVNWRTLRTYLPEARTRGNMNTMEGHLSLDSAALQREQHLLLLLKRANERIGALQILLANQSPQEMPGPPGTLTPAGAAPPNAAHR